MKACEAMFLPVAVLFYIGRVLALVPAFVSGRTESLFPVDDLSRQDMTMALHNTFFPFVLRTAGKGGVFVAKPGFHQPLHVFEGWRALYLTRYIVWAKRTSSLSRNGTVLQPFVMASLSPTQQAG